MKSIKIIIAALFLLVSSQSSATFMPAGFQVEDITTVVSNDVGC